ncbi:MAG: shikimate kinase [Acidimicrobiia bacterium]
MSATRVAPGRSDAPAAGPFVVLVGLMGSGKSAVGRRLSRRLGLPFSDSDAIVERLAGRSVRDVFAVDGEAAFRELERRAVAEGCAATGGGVFAVAGGAVLDEGSRRALRARATHVVWLDAPTDELLRRTSRAAHRPALDRDAAGTLAAMREAREVLYRELATARVETGGRDLEAVTEEVARTVGAV